MDIRRSINTKVWSDDWFETLEPADKLLWIYLLTNSLTNMLGIYEISKKRISFETGLTIERISKAFEGFERVKKCFYWYGFVVLPNWMKNQSLNTNMIISAERLFYNLPKQLNDKLLEIEIESFESLSKGLEVFTNPSEKGKGKGKGKGTNGLVIDDNYVLNDLGWSNDELTYNSILRKYPKLLKMKVPLSYDQHQALIKKWGEENIKDIYSEMQNYAKLLSNNDEAAKTANNWLRRNEERKKK